MIRNCRNRNRYKSGGQRATSVAQRGFTLVELLVVTVIVGVLASIAVPAFTGYLLEGRLNAAMPIMLEIAAKQRIRKNERGKYFGQTGTTHTETALAAELGVPLEDSGDFCFIFVCKNGECSNTANTGITTNETFTSTKDANDLAIEFEVWAILRGSSSGNIAAAKTFTCTPETNKQSPSGFVSTTAGDIGLQGSIVVYRYPPPTNRLDPLSKAYDSVQLDWIAGISKSHAMLDKATN